MKKEANKRFEAIEKDIAEIKISMEEKIPLKDCRFVATQPDYMKFWERNPFGVPACNFIEEYIKLNKSELYDGLWKVHHTEPTLTEEQKEIESLKSEVNFLKERLTHADLDNVKLHEESSILSSENIILKGKLTKANCGGCIHENEGAKKCQQCEDFNNKTNKPLKHTKSEIVDRAFSIAKDAIFTNRKSLSNLVQDSYFSGYMDCYDFIIENKVSF